MKKTCISLTALTSLTLAIMTSCNRPVTEGPAINDLFGVFEIVDSLQLSNASPDFSLGETVRFSCEFSKPVNWTLSIVGLETGSINALGISQVNCCLNKGLVRQL